MHSDFIHSAGGHPVYFETTDNYLDLRERLFALLGRFRTELDFGAEKTLTLVIDRGIFSAEIFARFVGEEQWHLITWEKDYRQDGWDAGRPADGEIVYQRERNHSQDLQSYRFSYQDHRWEKDGGMRRLIVRATNPRGKSVEVAVLSDDLQREAGETILLIFRRWVQENDFKYLDKHFGIDQITSYRAVAYEELGAELADKEMLSEVYRNLQKQRRKETAELKNVLWKRERAQRREARREEEIEELARVLEKEPDVEKSRALRKSLGSHRGQKKRAASNLARWEQAIGEHHEKIEQLGQQLKETGASQSRLEKLIEDKAVKMRGAPKRLMDALKILARNLFYILLEPFKEDYDNYRDDHVIFRSLTQSGGTIEGDEEQVRCRLLLQADYAPSIRRTLARYLRLWNQLAPEFPDGSGRRLVLELTTAAGIQLAPQNLPNNTKP